MQLVTRVKPSEPRELGRPREEAPTHHQQLEKVPQADIVTPARRRKGSA